MRERTVVAVLAALALFALLLTASSVVAGPPWPGSEIPDIHGEVIIAGVVDTAINYQGRLTDSGGSPLTGTYDFEFGFWDAATGGTQVGSNVVSDVTVIDGLFNLEIPVTHSWFNGQALWLEVRARPQGGGFADWMTPRQEILAAPYALSLRPGARIDGAFDNSAALYLVNSGSGTAHGLNASGTFFGVYGTSSAGIGVWGVGQGGNAGVAGWNTSSGPGVLGYSAAGGAAIQANGKIASTADSYIWVNATNYTDYFDGDFNVFKDSSGYLWLAATGVGDAHIELPADIPLVLYGQPVRVEEIELCYRTMNSATYIDHFEVYKTFNSGQNFTMVNNGTDFGDTTYTCRAYTPDAADQLMAADEGGLSAVIYVHGGGAGQDIYIYGLRIRLGHAG